MIHFPTKNPILDKNIDPDVNFFSDHNIPVLDTNYHFPNEVKEDLKDIVLAGFSILHLNMRCMKKNFESFRELLLQMKFDFRIICLSETWRDDYSYSNNSLFHLPNYNVVHQVRSNKKVYSYKILLHTR